ncbi:precorrin-2 dehydrogenase/sirohydrochlorin ferrochelatase family protein [Litchfieldia alkalitelluris]|uniref:precorrin-2 dehydrogenase/sirohydrochlorin ferrochelatase family protein n=1 Tax=Litchfieldia alkalitelluris TaxID=304268 RepID=UPI0009975C76|nr:NAD(P)-dependent oxidoreductase [Litchfieldia alkalitelluris]
MLPIMLEIEGKPCVVIGGGKIALRKVKLLLDAKAEVTVVSPVVCEEIKQLSLENQVDVLEREVEKTDYLDKFLTIAATDSIELNKKIAANIPNNQLINVVNKHELGNFHIPASFARGKLNISISTSGASPHLAKKIKQDLMKKYDESYEEYLEFLFNSRELIKLNVQSLQKRSLLLEELLALEYRDSESARNQFIKKITP